ncbi:hypothetical protein [Providencia sneebia]|uniref:Uncharacterized protein n=1 Tax=Providencia sneebia DSM 19967 TaxID=1141660 RepID=K8VXF2_9GAMM|nr:hypothetical protein [Providencia sneebia]EKT52839.1 hypothetical protein OO7_16315 [Providencia sneebia DSM 19967]
MMNIPIELYSNLFFTVRNKNGGRYYLGSAMKRKQTSQLNRAIFLPCFFFLIKDAIIKKEDYPFYDFNEFYFNGLHPSFSRFYKLILLDKKHSYNIPDHQNYSPYSLFFEMLELIDNGSHELVYSRYPFDKEVII